MSYTAYITRDDSSYPFLVKEPPITVTGITEDDWAQVVMSDPELKRIDEYSAKWIGHDLPFIFDPDLHTVEHNDPRPEVIEKMLALATLLGAVVRGGDGEIYSSGTESEFPGHAFSMVQADNTLQSAWLAYLPVVVGLLVMLAVDHLYGTFLISLVAGSAAIFGTFLLLLAISFFQR